MVAGSVLAALGDLSVNLPLAFGIGDKTYFQILFWPGGGIIGIFLWLLSVVMVGMVIMAFLTVRRSNIMPPLIKQQIQTLFENKQYREAIEMTAVQGDTLSYMMHSALAEAPRGYASMEKALQEAAEDRTGRLLRTIEYLNLMGNVGPMIGLLGTVWGMILAFFTIVAQGGVPDPGKLAEALGIKLVCTLVGLLVAIPSLTVYGILRNRVDSLSADTINTGMELLGAFKPGAKPAAPAATTAAAAPAPAPARA